MPKQRASRTTLERRGRLVFGGVLAMTVLASLSWPWLQMGGLARSGDLDRARERALALLHLRHGIHFAGDPKRAEPLSKFATRGAEKGRLVRLRPAPAGQPQENPAPAGSLMAEGLALFLEHPEESQLARETGDTLHYVQALRAQGDCLGCHSEYGEGELLGAVSLDLDVAERNETLLVNRLILAGAALAVVVVAMAAFHALFRYVVVRPIQHLKDVADRVSDGDLQVRSEIDTHNELEALSDALNRMLDQMQAAQAELRAANEVRDAKLDELAKANVALFEMNQMKSKFLATMSHELRTPLNSILGFAQILGEADAITGDPKLDRYLDNIQKSGRMLLEMINDLLDLAKIESGRVQVRCERVSPADLAEVAVHMVRPMLGEKELALEIEVDPTTPVMTTDATKVQQILYNLLSNAIKFTDEGEVRLEVEPAEDGRVVFAVSDTGVGIAREQQLRIFERFTQLDSSYTRRYRGTGLGLSIVKDLTALLGGDVSVASEPGAGSTFTVVLPADSSDAEGRTAEDARPPGGPASDAEATA